MTDRTHRILLRAALVIFAAAVVIWTAVGVLGMFVLATDAPVPVRVGTVGMATSGILTGTAALLALVAVIAPTLGWLRRGFIPWITARDTKEKP